MNQNQQPLYPPIIPIFGYTPNVPNQDTQPNDMPSAPPFLPMILPMPYPPGPGPSSNPFGIPAGIPPAPPAPSFYPPATVHTVSSSSSSSRLRSPTGSHRSASARIPVLSPRPPPPPAPPPQLPPLYPYPYPYPPHPQKLLMERPPSNRRSPSIIDVPAPPRAPSIIINAPAVVTAPSSSTISSSSSRITGRYGISELLNCQLHSYPYLDWLVYHDLSLARQWVVSKSGVERCQSVSFDRLAVIPPINHLFIRSTEMGKYTPVGHALEKWGDIRVCRFDRFLSIGDVLHEIWAYFNTPLTEEEKANTDASFAARVEGCFQKRWMVQGSLPDQCVKRRCDTLLDRVRFGGLEIGLDFETTSVLYLSLKDGDIR